MLDLHRLKVAREHLTYMAMPGPQASGDLDKWLAEIGVLRSVFRTKEPVPASVKPPSVRAHSIPVKVTPPAPAPTIQERPRRVPASASFNADRYVPIRVLWVKVIIRAAYDYALWKESKELRLRKFAQDAERWLFEPSDLELSFENICASFDFSVEQIRAKARILTKDDVKKLEFRERHGRTDRELIGGDDE
jgi:hypothetical protein